MVHLLVCDDSAEVRAAVRAMLADAAEIEVVAEAGDGEEAIRLALEHRPDVVLIDVSMPVLDGVAATRRLRELLPAARIVAFTGADDTDVVMTMLDAGADAYVVKGGPIDELVRELTAGGTDPLVRLARALAGAAAGAGDEVVRELHALARARFVAVYLLDDEGALRLEASAGVGAPAASELAAAAVVSGASVRGEGEVALPLVHEQAVLGALLVSAPRVEEELVAAVADLAAASIANERRVAESHAEARRDPLTGLGNKRAFDELLAAQLEHVGVFGGELAVATFDLDDFKRVNDTHGHAAGDRVLREVARVCERVLRVDEQVFRVGGEEFAVVIEGGAAAATRAAERVRTALRRQRRGDPLPTISAGVAAYPEHAQSAEGLLRRADVALYAAKWAGKDCVVVFGAEREPAPRPRRRLPALPAQRLRLLVVDDDDGLRALLRTTLEAAHVDVDEAETAAAAARRISVLTPDIVVLDVGMPGIDGLAYCRELKSSPATRDVKVVLLTGAEEGTPDAAAAAGADAFLRKPFSPLELQSLIERVAANVAPAPFRVGVAEPAGEQLLVYARDLRRLLDIERGQRALLQKAYRETVSALAGALESKDTGTGAHSQRVQRYAVELARLVDSSLLADASVEYGFLLHDVGKIGIPDDVLLKPAPLTPQERKLMETHTVLGEQMLRDVALLQGEGLRIVRGHHERWDGRGYPDRRAADEIPLGARVFAIADTLDAITSERPYRAAGRWEAAVAEIAAQRAKQFDPDVVDAFLARERTFRDLHDDLVTAA